MNTALRSVFAAALLASPVFADGGGITGYYRQPALRGETPVFVAEGDLWRVPVSGGRATRITSHPGDEAMPAISRDGTKLAFTGQYEGPTEVYVMPLAGGLPERLTFDAARASVHGWTSDGKVVASTDKFSTLPNYQLYTIDPSSRERKLMELAQASEGDFETDAGSTLAFTRLQFQGSFTKRYKGGTAQNLWRFKNGDAEATALTPDFAGTSKRPQWWQGRIYFLTDRDGTMNIWSMLPDGKDLKQHTQFEGIDVREMSLDAGKVAFRHAADIHLMDLAAGTEKQIPITLDSDFDQTRERWVKKPMDYVTSAHVSADGERVVLTARGRVFDVPQKQGRLVAAGRDEGVRYRNARFTGDGKSIIALSDKSGEVELWKLAANGVGNPEQLTTDGDVLRWDVLPSPDGKFIASHDKNLRLWMYDVEKKSQTKIDQNDIDDFSDLEWSGDSKWLAYVSYAPNNFHIVKLWSAASGQTTAVTTDRLDSSSPWFSTDGKWLLLLSERNLKTIVSGPWGPNQPDPFLDKTTKIYGLALKPGERWPFQQKDELQPPKDKKKDEDKKKEEGNGNGEKKDGDKKDEKDLKKDEKKEPAKVDVDLNGIAARLYEVPVPAGNYGHVFSNDKVLFYTQSERGEGKAALFGLTIGNEAAPEPKQVVPDITQAEISGDGKKILVRKADTFYLIEASAAAVSDLEKKAVDLSGWMLSVTPREEWRQMFAEAWRLERDYFYDTGMHGVNWKGMLEKYKPQVDRVATRAELSDLISQMVGELSALRIFVRGGDVRTGDDQVAIAGLGAVLSKTSGGYKVEKIYQSDPDDPQFTAPLAKPGVDVKAGDVIETINGVSTATGPDISALLRNQVGKQVLLHVKPAAGESRDVIAVPISQAAENDLRYSEWEYTRRQMVEEWGKGEIGYLHLRAMGGENFTEFVRGFYPVFTRKGLIIDVRHNRGGNIDSWILGKLMRKAWFYWSGRVGNPPSWNMQYAFRGHMVCLCNERTASDGEAFSEGFKRLGLGKVMGTRTWGGEIWLSSSNVLVDRIATAAETGVYGPDGQWLIEGHGVEPDIVVDNLPHGTFKGEDAQLKAAVEHLQKLIAEKPVADWVPPKKPDKSFENK